MDHYDLTARHRPHPYKINLTAGPVMRGVLLFALPINMNAGILRGMGDSKASLWFLIVSCITNIVLDLVFVAGLGMDAGGVAMQSLINAQGSVFMAATSVGGRVLNLTNVALNALSSASTTFSGQNYGAKNHERLRQGALRIPAAYLIDRFFDGTWVMAGIPISFCFGLLCMTGFYLLSPAWKMILTGSVIPAQKTLERQ